MKYIRVIITMMSVLCIVVSCTIQKTVYKERLEEAKGYALCACIAYMNKSVDSLSIINKDYSGGYFIQFSHISPDEMIKIHEYVEAECMKHWGVPQEIGGNMIGYSSWKFYNSPQLDNFIRKIIKKNIGNNER